MPSSILLLSVNQIRHNLLEHPLLKQMTSPDILTTQLRIRNLPHLEVRLQVTLSLNQKMIVIAFI